MRYKTVEELITALQEYPSDTYICDIDGQFFETIMKTKSIPLGDTTNPDCEYTEGIMLI